MKPAPSSFRDMLRLFVDYNPEAGLDTLFNNVDWSTASIRQLAHAFLARPPANVPPGPVDPAAAARALFDSDDCQSNLLRRTLEAFPARRRLLFVHLPKCAGSDFEGVMRADHPQLFYSLSEAGALSRNEVCTALRVFMRRLPKSDTIFVGGHVPLNWYIDNLIYRYSDRLMTIVRHPHDIAVSFANYVVKCFKGDPDFTRGDVRQWAKVIGIDPVTQDWSPAASQDLARRIVTMDRMMPVNPMCKLLGDGTAESVFRNFARVDIEITDVSRYTAWLKACWGIARTNRFNVSPALITLRDLSDAERARIAAATSEDMRIYTPIMAKLNATGRLSIMSPELF